MLDLQGLLSTSWSAVTAPKSSPLLPFTHSTPATKASLFCTAGCMPTSGPLHLVLPLECSSPRWQSHFLISFGSLLKSASQQGLLWSLLKFHFPVNQKKNEVFLLVFFVEHEVNAPSGEATWPGGERTQGGQPKSCWPRICHVSQKKAGGRIFPDLCRRITWEPPWEFGSPGPVTLGLRQKTPRSLPHSQLRGLSSLSPL